MKWRVKGASGVYTPGAFFFFARTNYGGQEDHRRLIGRRWLGPLAASGTKELALDQPTRNTRRRDIPIPYMRSKPSAHAGSTALLALMYAVWLLFLLKPTRISTSDEHLRLSLRRTCQVA
jgi:hypothetical protein